MSNLLTVAEFAQLAGVTEKTVRRMLERGEIQYAYSTQSRIMIAQSELAKIQRSKAG